MSLCDKEFNLQWLGGIYSGFYCFLCLSNRIKTLKYFFYEIRETAVQCALGICKRVLCVRFLLSISEKKSVFMQLFFISCVFDYPTLLLRFTIYIKYMSENLRYRTSFNEKQNFFDFKFNKI